MLRVSWNLQNVQLELINAVLAKSMSTENSTTSAEGRKQGQKQGGDEGSGGDQDADVGGLRQGQGGVFRQEIERVGKQRHQQETPFFLPLEVPLGVDDPQCAVGQQEAQQHLTQVIRHGNRLHMVSQAGELLENLERS